MEKIIRVIENGMAYGNYNGNPFDYNIKTKELTFVDPLGKPRTNWIESDSLQEYLDVYFDEETSEMRRNILRGNGSRCRILQMEGEESYWIDEYNPLADQYLLEHEFATKAEAEAYAKANYDVVEGYNADFNEG